MSSFQGTLCWSAIFLPAHISLTRRSQSSVSVFRLASNTSGLLEERIRREGIRTSRNGAVAIFTALTETREAFMQTGRVRVREPHHRRATPDLYVPELCDFKEARLSLSEHEQTLLGHSNFTNAAGGLDAGRKLVDALVIVETIYDLGGQADVSCLSFCLLPGGVEHPEHVRFYLFALGWDEQREGS